MRNVIEICTARLSHRQGTRWQADAPPRPAARPRPGCGSSLTAAGALALGGLLHALPAQAIEFGDGEFQGSLDTTISHGLTFRVEERNDELASGANDNDGNLNYDRGLVSNTSKFTTDLDVGVGDFGAFVRATGFIDFENQNGARERTPLSDAAKERVGRDLEVLDAYVTGTADVGDAVVDMRLGKHVLNWGESTFIPNGINAINHFDVSKLRLPGSELREALLPVSMASLSVAPTDTLSVEGFYQLDWEATEIDPVGSYYSTTDYVGLGAEDAVITLPGLDLGDMGLTAGAESIHDLLPDLRRRRFQRRHRGGSGIPHRTAWRGPRAGRLGPVGGRATVPGRGDERHRVRFLLHEPPIAACRSSVPTPGRRRTQAADWRSQERLPPPARRRFRKS